MPFHDLHVPARGEPRERRPDRHAQRRDPEAEVAGPQHRHAFRRRPERRLVLGGEPGGAGHERRAARGTARGGRPRSGRPAEVHHDVARLGHRFDIVTPYPVPGGKVHPLVNARVDREIGRPGGGGFKGATHAPGGAHQHDADHAPAAAPASVSPTARAASSTALSVAGSTGTSGSRSSFAMNPISESRNLIGPGFDSRNAALKSGMSVWCAASAAAGSPARGRSLSARICFGAACPTTDTMPSPPTAAHANVRASSPERSVSRVRVFTCAIWSRFPDASLTAFTFGRSCTMARMSGVVFVPVRPGTL